MDEKWGGAMCELLWRSRGHPVEQKNHFHHRHSFDFFFRREQRTLLHHTFNLFIHSVITIDPLWQPQMH